MGAGAWSQAIVGGIGEAASSIVEGESIPKTVWNVGTSMAVGGILNVLDKGAKGYLDGVRKYNSCQEKIKDMNLSAIEAIPAYIREAKIHSNFNKRLAQYNRKSYIVSYGASKISTSIWNTVKVEKRIGWGCKYNGATGEKTIYPIYVTI